MSPYCGTHVKHTLLTVPPHIHPINGPFSGTTWVSRYQKDKTNLDFTEARDIEWQWHQLGHMPCSRQITTPAPHHSVLYRPEALPANFPIRSKQRDICYYVNADWQMSKDQFWTTHDNQTETRATVITLKTKRQLLYGTKTDTQSPSDFKNYNTRTYTHDRSARKNIFLIYNTIA